MNRFFAPLTSPLQLIDEEAHHCSRVLRHAVGDRVRVFDGMGRECLAQIQSITKHRVELSALEHAVTPAPHPAITLFQAIPKGAKMDLIVQKATELGVRAVVPLVSERTVVQLDPVRSVSKSSKWRHTAIEAAKQCGLNWVPDVRPLRTLAEALGDAAPLDLSLAALLHPAARPFRSALPPTSPNSIGLFVGPEGDFAPHEVDLLLASPVRPIRLGSLILRTETAALFALSALRFWFEPGSHPAAP